MILSIIVPVYNIENFIHNCIESLLNQSINETYEIICINDGSVDHSLDILNDFSAIYPNIKIYSQSNSGLCAARNKGLEMAKGKYICFCDGDDIFLPSKLNKLISICEQFDLDLLGFNYVIDSIDKNVIPEIDTNNGNVNSGEKWLINRHNFHYMVWCYIYRKDYLDSNNLRFEKGITHEDMLFTPLAILFAKRMMVIDEVCYKYIKRENSITTTKNSSRCYDILKIAEIMQKYTKIDKYRSVYEEFFSDYIVALYFSIPNLAINMNISLRELFSDKELFNKVIEGTISSNKKRNIARFFLKHKFYSIYKLIFIVQTKILKPR